MAGKRARMILDLPKVVQMAIRLQGIESGRRTGEVVEAAIAATYPEDVKQAKEIQNEGQPESPPDW